MVDQVAEEFELIAPEERGRQLKATVAAMRLASPAADPNLLRMGIARLVEIVIEANWNAWSAAPDETKARPPSIGDYAACRCELGTRDDWPASLISHEYYLRIIHHDKPDRDSILASFPNRSDELLHAFERAERDAALSSLTIPGIGNLVEIGRGSMGVVYRGVQAGLNRPVAVKILRTGAFEQRGALRRFQLEAISLADIKHPNVVEVFLSGEIEGHPYLVLELVEGGSLKDWLARLPEGDRTVSDLLAAATVRDLALAAQVVHTKGVIHRDLKPGNILLARRQEAIPGSKDLKEYLPKLTDFGLVKRLDASAQETATHSGTVLGTPAYMAPEQARCDLEKIGPATDVYALGAILYELLTGRPPFVGPGVMATLYQINDVDAESDPPRKLRPGVAKDIEKVALKCLDKQAGRRYGSDRELAEDLDRFVRKEPVLARPVGRLRAGGPLEREEFTAGLGPGVRHRIGLGGLLRNGSRQHHIGSAHRVVGPADLPDIERRGRPDRHRRPPDEARPGRPPGGTARIGHAQPRIVPPGRRRPRGRTPQGAGPEPHGRRLPGSRPNRRGAAVARGG